MTLALANSLIRCGGYVEWDVITSYLAWANAGTYMMGTNTRNLFKSVKTVKGYQTRWQRIFGEQQMSQWTQSNGCLMRAASLVCVSDEAVLRDCALTNPHPINKEAVLTYVRILRGLLVEHTQPLDLVLPLIQEPTVKDCVLSAISGKPVDLTSQKGWVLHGLYCAIRCLVAFDQYQKAVDWVINQSGNTDTNAAIAGALMGAKLGLTKLRAEHEVQPKGWGMHSIQSAVVSRGRY